jgi:hypothetical protein
MWRDATLYDACAERYSFIESVRSPSVDEVAPKPSVSTAVQDTILDADNIVLQKQIEQGDFLESGSFAWDLAAMLQDLPIQSVSIEYNDTRRKKSLLQGIFLSDGTYDFESFKRYYCMPLSWVQGLQGGAYHTLVWRVWKEISSRLVRQG